ncbi:tyrosine-type recombinase/integrase [Streptomyces sp. NBC_00424]|uniref:tyrosine-type recombinase/integrase n=1 Tax=Streptomyces sp. NBC_00424 TaxID=2903648 RepID=UPI002252E809|nr:tyrosine-type recombinase/integrase [Streptomyces sp. NBC_00424]MCX5077727.1 tyrosine-type recombinase/integrase [Streptomyces sp. NBC_00424]
MSRGTVIGDLRVQEIRRRDGRIAYTIMEPGGPVHVVADSFLRVCDVGTARTYAYLLVDHLRWLPYEGLSPETVTFYDLQRYMGAVGAEFSGPFGQPWREGKKPYRQSTLGTAAAALKGFYVHQGKLGINEAVAGEFGGTRLPTKADRNRALLGHVQREMPANKLRPKRVVRRRHPKLPPEGAREVLLEDFKTARDRMVVTWLDDGGFRIGELAGMHVIDLHLRQNASCGECSSAHVHICHRETNVNRSRVKTKQDWVIQDGVVQGGTIRRASPAMVHTYFEYMTTEYPPDATHGMLLVNLCGPTAGLPWSTDSARRLLKRAGYRLELGLVKPHMFRHQFGSAVLDAADGNAMIARDAGGWASAQTVEEVYGHTDIHDPAFVTALNTVWGEPS